MLVGLEVIQHGGAQVRLIDQQTPQCEGLAAKWSSVGSNISTLGTLAALGLRRAACSDHLEDLGLRTGRQPPLPGLSEVFDNHQTWKQKK